jgi:hypothetical protein
VSDLFDDLQDGSGRDYFFALDSAPGGLSPALGTITAIGLAPTIFEQLTVFRTPALATLTVNGLAVVSDITLKPAVASLTISGQIPSEYRERIITPAIPTPDYADLQDTPPTILFISTITPTAGLVQLSSLPLNVTPGGNIGFISPALGALTIQGVQPVLIFVQVTTGSISMVGLAPAVMTEKVISPDTGALIASNLQMTTERPFGWIDADPPPPLTWTTTTGIAA